MSVAKLTELRQKFLNNFMDINNSTFCAAPWFQIRTDSNGNFRACCDIDQAKTEFIGPIDLKYPKVSADQWFNSDYIQYVRQKLSDGNQIKECGTCWQKEKNGAVSQRQISNNTVTNNHGHQIDQSWVKAYFKHKIDYKSDLLLAADVKLTNLCNFACSMCSPSDSSKIYAHWHQTKDSKWVEYNLSKDPAYLNQVRTTAVEKNNYQLLKFVIAQQTPNIKVLGGEPLLDTEMMSMLVSIPDQQKQKTALTFVTNGSVSLLETVKQLGKFKHIHFSVSLDGIGIVQDWIRQGSDWENVSNNLDQFCNQMPASCSISSQCTVQAMSLLHVDQLIMWTAQRNIPLLFSLLTKPECMSVAAVPDKIRHECYARLAKLVSPIILENSFKQTLLPSSLISMIKDIPVDTSNHFLLANFLEWYDQNQTWKTIFPEWCEYLS